MGLSTLIIIFSILILLAPYILALIIRLLFREHIKSLSVKNYYTFTKILIKSRDFSIYIDSFSLFFTRSSAVLYLKSISITIPSIPEQSSNNSQSQVPLSSINSILIRLLLSIFCKFFIVKLNKIEIESSIASFILEKGQLSFDLDDHSGSITSSLLVSRVSANSSWMISEISTILIKFVLPGHISFNSSLKNSETFITIGTISLKLDSIPAIKFPGNAQVPKPEDLSMKFLLKVHNFDLDLFSVPVSLYSLEFTMNPLNLTIGLVDGGDFNRALHIPELIIRETNEVIEIQSSYLKFSLEEILLITSKILQAVKVQDFAEDLIEKRENIKIQQMQELNRKKLLIKLSNIEAKFPGKQGSVIEVQDFLFASSSNLEISTNLIQVSSVLKLTNFSFKDQALISVSFSELDGSLTEDIIKEFVSLFSGFYRETFLSQPSKPKPKPREKKTVSLAFERISVFGHYPDGFKILITVDKFSATINPKSFSLFFLNSNIFDLETEKFHIISTTVCKVDKDYNQGTANISVLGEEIGINLPRKYYLARAVLKFLRGTHKIYKWCKFAFLQSHRTGTYIAEKAKLELKFKDFKFIAEDDPLDHMNLKKMYLRPEEDILRQMMTLQLVNNLLTLSCKSALVKLNNFELDTMEKLRSAIEDLDEFEMPGNEFFAVILAYDFTCLGRKVVMSIRDYPYEFCRISAVKFGGRSILTKNRVLYPIWGQYKHHSAIEVSCKEVDVVVGICLLRVLVDLMKLLKYIFLLRSGTAQQMKKLDLIDFLRYFLHGSMNISVSCLRTFILRTSSPYQYEYFNFDIATCEILAKGESTAITCADLVFYKEETLIMSIPNTNLLIQYDILSKSKNHWIVSNNLVEKIEDFLVESINIVLNIGILQSDKKFSIYCHLIDSDIIDDFLSLITNPPVYLIPARRPSSVRFFKKFNIIELRELKLFNLDVFIILNPETCEMTDPNDQNNQITCLKVPAVHLSADCVAQPENSLVPFMVKSAQGSCCNMLMVQNIENSEKFLLKCFIIEYGYSCQDNHRVNIEGFEVFICNFFINLITELVSTQPKSMKKIILNKKRLKTRKLGVKHHKMTSRVVLSGSISNPIISVLSEESESQILVKGGHSKFEIIENALKFDNFHKDTKKQVRFLIEIIECFIHHQDETLAPSKIFDSKEIQINLTIFSMPFNEIDFAHDCLAVDKFIWYKEKRINRVEFIVPELSSNIESEDFWVLIEVVKGYIGFIPKHQISFSERLMEDEFKIYGGRELVVMFQENMKKSETGKTSESNIVYFSLEKLNVVLKKSLKSIIELDIQGFRFLVSTFTDKSCQKSLEVYKILMRSGVTEMISPLLMAGEEYLRSNNMVTLRILDRWIKGSEVFWPVIDHLEFLVYPLNINFSKEIYKDLYSYFFQNQEKESCKGRTRRISLPRLYKYVHLNEFKICITVTGWIPLKQSKITLKSFTRQNKFKTLQGIFDKIMKHELKSMINQIPSICIQNIGISKKNFLPSTEAPQRSNSFLDKLKRNKTEKSVDKADMQKKEGIKLMFGKDFK